MFTTAAAPANLAPVRSAARRRAMSTSPSIPDRSAGPVPPELSGERLLVGFVAAVGVVVLSVAAVALLGGGTAALVGAFALLLVMTVAIVITILALLADVPADRRAEPRGRGFPAWTARARLTAAGRGRPPWPPPHRWCRSRACAARFSR